MNSHHLDDFSHSLLELFRAEAENQTAILTGGLLELERTPATPRLFEALLRAAHSLKGAARIVNLPAAVHVAHALEDCFVAAQTANARLSQADIDVLFRGVDLLLHFSRKTNEDLVALEQAHAPETREFLAAAERMMAALRHTGPPRRAARERAEARPPEAGLETAALPARSPRKPETPERVLRLTAENLNRLLALAGESLVESRWLRPFSDSLQRLKRLHEQVAGSLEASRQALQNPSAGSAPDDQLGEALERIGECRQFLAEKLEELELFDRRSAHLSHRLYLEVLRARMRPFGDGVRRFPRMVRDLARTLGKEVRLEIHGEITQVDRDILEQLEAPLAHLLRNAVDHGCETPAERERAGKPPEGVIRLEAYHSAGMLVVGVSDDGAGVDQSALRQSVVTKKLAAAAAVDKLGEMELLEYLFLPGFSLKQTVTEISGRGFGLDVVQNMVRSVRGAVRVSTQPGRGTRFQLQLPLTLSVLRTLLVNVGGEPYAIPLSQIIRTLSLTRDKILTLEGRQYFTLGNQQIGLVMANQALDCEPRPPGNELAVVVLGDRHARYGLIVDRFLGERELVVQPLDSRLGKVKDINAAALMDDGLPVLVLDVADLLESIERLIANGLLARISDTALSAAARKRKRILAVDDSLTVRELERKLLAGRGYLTDVAVDGIDGWNAVRTGHYDLVIIDVDMPRMDGIELAALIKKDPDLKSVAVMIVSYKERDEDRLRGMEAGADYYLTKGSFHDETLLQAVVDLIGPAES